MCGVRGARWEPCFLLWYLIEMNNQHLNEKKSHLSVDYFGKMHIIKIETWIGIRGSSSQVLFPVQLILCKSKFWQIKFSWFFWKLVLQILPELEFTIRNKLFYASNADILFLRSQSSEKRVTLSGGRILFLFSQD